MRRTIAGLIFFSVLIILCCIQVVSAVPPLPAEYYGDLIIDGSQAPAGTTITAYIQDTMKGSLTTVEPGKFGGSGLFDPRLKVNVSEEEYQTGNLSVRFFINGLQANQIIPFESGTARELAISIGTQAVTNPVQTITPFPEQTIIAAFNTTSPEIINNPPQSQIPASQGLLNEMKYTSDDGVAELILKKDTIMLSPSGQFVQNIALKSRNINDLAVISDKSLLFSGYAYEITPEKTYFNLKGMLRINIPLERTNDLFAMNPQLYQYDTRMLSWNHIDTGKNQFNGIISADVNEGAVYALFFAKNNQGTTPISPLQTQVPNIINYPQYSMPSGNQPQPPLQPSSQIYNQGIISAQSEVVLDSITPITASETIIPVTEHTQNFVNNTNASDYPELTPETTKTEKTPEPSEAQVNGPDSSPVMKMTFGPGLTILVIIFLIIIVNIIIYLTYTRWWQKKQ